MREYHAKGQLLKSPEGKLAACESLLEEARESLTDAATALHCDRAHEGKFWDCLMFGCNTIRKLLERLK